MPQNPQAGKTTVAIVINGREFPPGTPLAEIRAAAGGGISNPGAPAPPLVPPPNISTPQGFNQFAQGSLGGNPNPRPETSTDRQKLWDQTQRTGGNIISLLAGLALKNPSLRVAGTALGGAIGSPDDRLGGAAKEAALEGIFGGFAPKGSSGELRKLLKMDEMGPGFTGHMAEGGLSEVVPYAGSRASLALAGVNGDKRAVANSAVNLRPPMSGGRFTKTGPATLARPARTQAAIGETSDAVKAVEAASTAKTTPSRFRGATDRASTSATRTPIRGIEDSSKIKLGEQQGVREMTLKANLPFNTNQLPGQAQRMIGEALKDPRAVHQLGLDAKASTSDIDMSTLGDIRRGTGHDASSFIEQRAKHENIDPASFIDGTVAESMHLRAKQLQDTLEPGVVPGNERLKNLYNVKRGGELIGNGSGSAAGQAGVRGGLTAGVAGNVAQIFPPARGAGAILAPLAVALGGPRTLSGMGNAFGTGSQFVPTIDRLLEAGIDDIPALMEELKAEQERSRSPVMKGVSFRKP